MNINMNEKTRVTLRTVCMLSLVLVIGMGATSCAPDECRDTYKVQQVSARQAVSTIDLSGMTGDLVLNPSDATNGEIQTTGDANLNGFELKVVNIKLTINGNLNGGGKVRTQGSNASVCVTGSIQNNPDTEGVTFDCGGNLSNPVLVAPNTIEADCGFNYNDTIEIDGKTYRIIY
jgi:hypothetical protein